MSANDPTDDELEREAARDVPLAQGGTSRHSPKLGGPRGISLAEVRGALQADRAARDERMNVSQAAVIGPTGFVGEALFEPLQQRVARRLEADAFEARLPPMRSPLAAQRIATGSRSYGPEPSPETTRVDDAVAWAHFVCAALPLCSGATDPEGQAALVADRLLEERRKRFP